MLNIFKQLQKNEYMPSDNDNREKTKAKIALIEKEMEKNTLLINIIISLIGLVAFTVIFLLAYNK